MAKGFEHQKLAVESGYWPMFRYNPLNIEKGKNPLKLDYKGPKIPLKEYVYRETRFKMLTKSHPERAAQLLDAAQEHVKEVWKIYSHMAAMDYTNFVENKKEESEEAK